MCAPLEATQPSRIDGRVGSVGSAEQPQRYNKGPSSAGPSLQPSVLGEPCEGDEDLSTSLIPPRQANISGGVFVLLCA